MKINDTGMFQVHKLIVWFPPPFSPSHLSKVMICVITKVPPLNLLKCQTRANIYIRIITTITYPLSNSFGVNYSLVLLEIKLYWKTRMSLINPVSCTAD